MVRMANVDNGMEIHQGRPEMSCMPLRRAMAGWSRVSENEVVSEETRGVAASVRSDEESEMTSGNVRGESGG